MSDNNQEISLLADGAQLVEKHLREKFTLKDTSSYEDAYRQLLLEIEEKIAYWLEHDYEYLLNLMYRIDVGEEAFRKALETNKPAAQLAQLVLEREIQKARSRKQFRENYQHGK
ncbi:MAG: hypothetical protein ACLFQO_05225 [Cyclobacteriaceae bacterium]